MLTLQKTNLKKCTNILCTPAEERDGTRKMPRSKTDARCPQTVPFKLTLSL